MKPNLKLGYINIKGDEKALKLNQLLKGLSYEVLKGSVDLNIKKINYNSKEVETGDVFFCIKGFKADGHEFARDAIKRGAIAIVCEEPLVIGDSVTVIKVQDSRKALSLCSSNYYDKPSTKMKIIGITGTNGKTTTAFMMKSVLEKAGYKVGIIGTVANYIGHKMIKSSRTTPESLELQKLFSDMVKEKVDYCVMEVSSHSLALDRVYGIKFSNAIFTNLTQDHLDFHKTMEEYFKAKSILFNNSCSNILNIDDQYGLRLFEMFKHSKTYAIEGTGNIMATHIINNSKGVKFSTIINEKREEIELKIPGIHNVYNGLAVIETAILNGIDIEYIKNGLKEAKVIGRCELIEHNDKIDFDIIIDFAHTPDGLEKILKSAREFTKGRLLCVFGCGGDRDSIKRPIMGNIATNLSDMAIITSDNPRQEEPIDIINDILKGVETNNYIVEENRREAIFKAMKLAKKDDVIVVAGKGHENYQILKDKTIEFDERKVIAELLEKL